MKRPVLHNCLLCQVCLSSKGLRDVCVLWLLVSSTAEAGLLLLTMTPLLMWPFHSDPSRHVPALVEFSHSKRASERGVQILVLQGLPRDHPCTGNHMASLGEPLSLSDGMPGGAANA